MPQSLADLSEALLKSAKSAGAEAADVIAVDGMSVSVAALNGDLEHAERSEEIDIGLRVLVGQRQACVSASDTSRTTFAEMAQRAVAMAREAPDDPTVGLAHSDQLATDPDIAALELCDPDPEPSPEMLFDAAARAEAAAFDVDGVTQVQSTTAGYGHQRFHLAATNGFSNGYVRTTSALSCVAISGEGAGMERDYFGDARVHAADLDRPETVGRIAAERAVARIGATKPPTGSYPVLFDERVASSLASHLLQAVNGAAIVRGASWLRDALGEKILPEHLSLSENPLRPRASGSRPFDAEGLPTGPRHIIAEGHLTGWTLDLATARKLGQKSTANAARSTSAPPSPSTTNIELTQGDQSRDDLIRDMGTGLLITSLIGSSINATTGDYSRGASGFWVENGEISHPVNECTVAGNLREMLLSIRPANDARPHLSRVVPSLLVEGLMIAGK